MKRPKPPTSEMLHRAVLFLDPDIHGTHLTGVGGETQEEEDNMNRGWQVLTDWLDWQYLLAKAREERNDARKQGRRKA